MNRAMTFFLLLIGVFAFAQVLVGTAQRLGQALWRPRAVLAERRDVGLDLLVHADGIALEHDFTRTGEQHEAR